MMSLLLLDNFYPVTSYRRVQKQKKTTNSSVYVVGHSLWSAIDCQRKWLIVRKVGHVLRTRHRRWICTKERDDGRGEDWS